MLESDARESTEWSRVRLLGRPAEVGETGEEGESETVPGPAGALGEEQCWPRAVTERAGVLEAVRESSSLNIAIPWPPGSLEEAF